MEEVIVKNCSQCGAPLDVNLEACKYCGEPVPVQLKKNQQQQFQEPPINQQSSEYQQPPVYQQSYFNPNVKSKSKVTAGVLAILLGGLGVHKFYLGKIGLGILYILFCWTYVPALIGLIEGIIYLTSSEEKFYYKYVLKNK
ncbi:TM2 domain-containing protein [Sedimentibacter sp. MB31-C6]|uniref:TM2 domain-containing protein n=1 Tax=Sedimentibacter sp. MB31-C6 TaxID=3109366 RepID=UPI002DDD0B4A|nr:TM2 domain-containing protein [Sedimentibacter sp. MB36-C1]WSI03896.1 TM2 domain-containing protein [Sedimentibacter sp. MB36-C1]